MADVLIISNGNAEDLMGAALAKSLSGLKLAALPLVGTGKPYEGVAQSILGPRRPMPSGGFPFNSWENFVVDIRAGFVWDAFKHWKIARAEGSDSRTMVVVGDAYALAVGCLAAYPQKPLFHIQPLVSYYYAVGRSLWERLGRPNQFGAEDFLFYERWMHRRVRATYVRDKLSETRAHQLGMHKARFAGSLAMDILPAPERDLSHIKDGRPILILMPGTRGDVGFSLPLMLECAALLPQIQAVVAWAQDFSQVPLPPGWSLEIHDDLNAWATQGVTRVRILRKAFSAILHTAQFAIGTAGTANEQAAGLGIPVVAFPTPGPQFIASFAQRQKRLLGESLILCEATPTAVAAALHQLHQDQALYARAAADGKERIGPPGALPQIAKEVEQYL